MVAGDREGPKAPSAGVAGVPFPSRAGQGNS
jgi:hypothetical protein